MSLIKKENEVNYNKGEIVEFYSNIPNGKHMFEAGYPRQYERVLDTGIVVSEKFETSRKSFRLLISIIRYKGYTRPVEVSELKKKVLPIEYKLSLIGKFKSFWVKKNKSIYQSCIIEALAPRKFKTLFEKI
jgi:hypothetical protein